MKRVAVCVLTVLTLAGCGGSASPDSSPSPSVASSSESSSPRPTAATPAQWASRVATDRDDWLDETKKFAEQCSWVIIALDGAPVTCSLQAFTLGLVAKTADAKMSTAVNELGKPPGEIESLVADLRTSAAAMDQAGEAIPDKCPEAGDRCADSWIAFERAVDDFQSALNAWAPYV